MPYRAELKRPDLKGQFPCSVCGKIFCHSSSLSRHRMQAHFKSYTCTQCSQEISSNETLRSHMFRMHSISRMFMCRCCNWAFPDKTSLHIHMQSMLRNGSPGDVAVLARSSTDDGPMRPIGECTPSFLSESKSPLPSNNNNLNTSNNNLGSIFPSMLKSDSLLQHLRKDGIPDASTLGSSNQWLAAWLANNPFAANLGMLSTPTTVETPMEQGEITVDEHDNDDLDTLEIKTTEEDLREEEERNGSPASVTVKSESGDDERSEKRGSQKRKTTRPQQVTDSEADTPLKLALSEKDGPSTEQYSPTVSDSHTSGSCHADHQNDHPDVESSRKCFECQIIKGRLNQSEFKLREYEQKIRQLETRVSELQRENLGARKRENLGIIKGRLNQSEFKLREYEQKIRQLETRVSELQRENLGARMETSQPAMPTGPLAPMMLPMGQPLPFMQNPAMKMLFHNFMQATINRQSC